MTRPNRRSSETRWRLQPRTRYLGVAGLLAVLAGASVPLLGEHGQPRHLTLEPDLASKLQLLAEGLHTEIVLCLHGTVRGDTARVTDFSMPEPRLSTFQRSAFLPCPAKTLAAWHNHPLVQFQAPPGQESPRQPAERRAIRPIDLCALSGKDIQTADRMGYAFTVVAVDAETWCWWTLNQVQQLVRQRAMEGRLVSGQGAGRM